MRVMVVDDSSAFREATIHLLRKNPDYNIIAEASDGKEAIKLYLALKPDVILMDIEMPVLDGLKATKKIRYFDKETKIIAVSAHLNKLYFKEAIEAGFSGFVYKNQMSEQLHLAIEHAFAGKLHQPADLY